MPTSLDITIGQRTQLLAAESSADPLTGVLCRKTRFGRAVRRDDLQEAWTRLLRAYPGLRVRFHKRDGGQIRQEVRDYDRLPDAIRTLLVTDGEIDTSQIRFEPYGPVLIRGYVTLSPEGGEFTLFVHSALVDEHALTLAVDFFKQILTGHGEADLHGEKIADYTARVQAVIEAGKDDLDTASGFWRRRLTPDSSVRAPVWPAGAEPAGGRLELPLEREFLDDLAAKGRAMRVSLPVLVHAAAVILLHRYNLGDRPVIGVPTSLRDHPAIGFGAVGPYSATLPIPTDVAGDDALADVVHRVRDTFIRIQEHKFVPAWETPMMSGPQRSRTHEVGGFPFGVGLAVHTQRANGSSADAASAVVGRPAAQLHIDVVVGDEGRLTVSWRDGVTPWPAAETIAEHLVRILRTLCQDPYQTVADIGLLTGAEIAGLDAEVNRDHTDEPGERELPGAIIQRICATSPDRPAVADPTGAWSYEQLERAVRQVRAAIRAHHLPVGSRVGVACGRSRWQVAAMVALWHEALCYVPLNHRGPAARNRLICDDAGIFVTIGDEASAPVLRTDQSSLLSPAKIQTYAPEGSAPAANRPDDLAYVIYTSGTSGRPKGVAITHANLASFVRAIHEAMPIGEPGRWLAESDATFDMSILEMIAPLTSGYEVIIADTTDISATPDGLGFDYRSSTPSRARQLLMARELGETIGYADVTPKVWMIGGEAFPPALLRDLRTVYPDPVFMDIYGPTEATVFSTFQVLTADHDDPPIGRPLPNTQIVIHDRYGHPAPAGTVGELLIGGSGVAAGYLGRPDLDAERFVHVPGPWGSRRMFRSGDLVQLGPDGALYYRGRSDDQVKIRGHRIEVAEVEHVLLDQDGIAEAAVFAVKANDGAETAQLAAAVVPRGGRSIEVDRLTAELAARLPDAMVPADITVLDSLPRMPGGKLDRALLAEQNSQAETHSQPALEGGTQPVDPITALVTDAVSRVIGRDVGPDDDFFRVGGNSLTALRLVSTLREHDIRLRAIDVFEGRTPRHIARAASRTTGGPAAPRTPWPPTGIGDIWASSIGVWDDEAPSPLLRLTPDHRGEGAPFFCVHGNEGTIRFLADAIDRVGADRVVYGLEAIGYRGHVRPLLSISELAERYLVEIRAVRPNGPYLLGGFGRGAIIALEIARRLRVFGEDVSALALIDLPAPPSAHDPGSGLDRLYAERWEFLRRRYGIEGPDDIPRVMAEMIDLGWYAATDDPADIYRLQALWAALAFAHRHYEPRKYDGRVAVLQSSMDARVYWEERLPNATIVTRESPLEIIHDRFFTDVIHNILVGGPPS